MNIAGPNAARRLAAATRPHLPGQADPDGVGVARLASGCDAFLADAGAPNPYANDVPPEQTRDISATLKELAELTPNETSIGQLFAATVAVGSDAQQRVDDLDAARRSLKAAYYKSTVKSIAWMAATAGALVLGGLLPNPVTGLIIAGAAAMSIRSITKARADHKELVRQLPGLEQSLAVNRQLAADSVFFAPHLQGWNDLLASQAGPRAA